MNDDGIWRVAEEKSGTHTIIGHAHTEVCLAGEAAERKSVAISADSNDLIRLVHISFDRQLP